MDFFFEDLPSTSQSTPQKGREDTQMVICDHIMKESNATILKLGGRHDYLLELNSPENVTLCKVGLFSNYKHLARKGG